MVFKNTIAAQFTAAFIKITPQFTYKKAAVSSASKKWTDVFSCYEPHNYLHRCSAFVRRFKIQLYACAYVWNRMRIPQPLNLRTS